MLREGLDGRSVTEWFEEGSEGLGRIEKLW